MTEEPTRYNSNPADPQMNLAGLNDLFNVSPTKPASIDSQLQELSNIRSEIQAIVSQESIDSDAILHRNIERANRILDKAEEEILNGAGNARFLEVVSQLINSVTSAATAIAGGGYNQQLLERKDKELEIKEQALLLKQTIKEGTGGNTITNNNLIVTSREELLRMISDEESTTEAEVTTLTEGE